MDEGENLIYVDADGCPVKDEIYKVADRLKVKVTLVANKAMKIPESSNVQLRIVTSGFDAADDWIVDQVTSNDLVVTADILLADRCLKKHARVLGHKGNEFTEDNIGMAVAQRELMQNLRYMGEVKGGPTAMDKKARSQFLSKLDQILNSLNKQNRS
jgi:uncharacterized protein YaiI (UPF0178 family)